MHKIDGINFAITCSSFNSLMKKLIAIWSKQIQKLAIRKEGLIHRSTLILSCAILFSMSTLATSVAAEEKGFWTEDYSKDQKAYESEKPDILTIEVVTNPLALLQNCITLGIEMKKTLWKKNIWGTIPLYPEIEVHYVEAQYARIENVETYGVLIGSKSYLSKSKFSSCFSGFWLGRYFWGGVSELKEKGLADFAISTTMRIGCKWLIIEKLIIEPRVGAGIVWFPCSSPYELMFYYPYGVNLGHQF